MSYFTKTTPATDTAEYTVKSGDILAEIETDKATMEVEAVDEGPLTEILVPAGTEGVKVNTPIAVIGKADAKAAAPVAQPAAAAPVAAAPVAAPAVGLSIQDDGHHPSSKRVELDVVALAAQGFLMPHTPRSQTADQYRVIKRPLIKNAMGKGAATLTQSGWPEISDLQIIGVAAGVETVLRCAGREGVKLTWRRTPTGVEISATWRG